MALPTLTFPDLYFAFETAYPNSSTQVQFGNSYTFTAPPTGPDQRTFRLYFTGMKYCLKPDGTLDLTASPKKNVALLEQFYRQVRQYTAFTFNHPAYGPIACTFSKPLSIPRGFPGGNGAVQDFQVDLLENIL